MPSFSSHFPTLNMPGRAHRRRKHMRRGGVVLYGFGLRVPAKFAAQNHGDLAKMADGGGAMRRLGGRDGGAPGLDAVEELAVMAQAAEKLDLVGADLLLKQAGRPGLQSAAIHPDPVAVLPDPFGAATNA